MRTRTALGGGLLAAAALLWVVLAPPGPATPTPVATDSGSAAAPGSAVHVADQPAGIPAADEGPGAPAVPDTPALLVPPADSPETAERQVQAVAGWLARLDTALKRRDWRAIRAAAAALRPVLPRYVAALTAALERTADPRRALVGGLLVEAYVERGALPDEARDRLAAVIVPLLARTLADEDAGEDRHHAARLVSRFPGDRARSELVAALDTDGDPTLRQYALFGLAAIGAPAELDRLATPLAGKDPELARTAALAMTRIARRDADPATLARVRRQAEPRLLAALEDAMQRGDHDHYGNVVGTLAELRGEDVRAVLSGPLLDGAASTDVKAQALMDLLGHKAVDALPALRARRGRLGDAGLERLLARVIGELERIAG